MDEITPEFVYTSEPLPVFGGNRDPKGVAGKLRGTFVGESAPFYRLGFWPKYVQPEIVGQII